MRTIIRTIKTDRNLVGKVKKFELHFPFSVRKALKVLLNKFKLQYYVKWTK